MTTVTTQKELDAAIAAEDPDILIASPKGVWLEVGGSAKVWASGSATVKAYESATVEASDSTRVSVFDSATVKAYESATVEASDSTRVSVFDSATVKAYGSATVEASDSAEVEARGSVTVRAYDSSIVRASISATVLAYDSATVEASDSARVWAYESSSIQALGMARVWAYDSAFVEARGSVTVRAIDSALVWASGTVTVWASGTATVGAGSHVAVHKYSSHATVKGGVIIDHTAVDLRDALEWCAYHRVTVKDGVATVYKAVADTWVSGHGTSYAPGTTPEATDWIDNNECGGGLHFSPTPAQASDYCYAPDMRFLACDVAVETLRPIPDETMPKCKAPRVISPCRPVDIMGRPLDTNGELA